MSGATKCTCLRDGERASIVLVVDPDCPAMQLHVRMGECGPVVA